MKLKKRFFVKLVMLFVALMTVISTVAFTASIGY
jgi:hypothetical protein